MSSSTSEGAAILLAAGNSSRFGSDKRFALIRGIPMLQLALRKYLEVFDRTIVVLKPGEECLLAATQGNFEVVIAKRAIEGMSMSIRAGVEAVDDGSWAVIGLADMPSVHTSTLALLRQKMETSGKTIFRPRYRHRYGNPVGVPCLYFDRLKQLSGDVGARVIFDDPSVSCEALDVEDAGILQDVDDAETLERVSAIT